ncbi:MAG TPA: ATP-binding protein [Myxococcales bacterium]|nr:ATP-binding protein [Myxococcales bacterium]
MSSTPVPGSATQGRLLVVDDEENILRSIRRVLRRGQWEIETASDGKRALEVFAAFQPAVVVSDFRMPGMNGVELLTRVKELAPRVQRIMLTGQADQKAIEDAINTSEIFRFIAKPWNDQQLLLTVQSAFEQFQLIVENERLATLTRQQNEELRALNHTLEERVDLRTRQLTTAKREWEKTFDVIDTPVAVVRAEDFSVKRANMAYARVAGRPVQEVASRPRCHQYLFGRDTPCERCPLKQALEERAEKHAEVSHGGRTYALWVYPMAEEGEAVCTYRDVTQEREVTRRMIETEKMAAVGQLAGGVAHEVNNPLGGILAFAQLMKRDPGRTLQDLESLDLIEESALRCKRIVESLLRFSRRSSDKDRHRFDLSRCVDDAVYLFRAQLKTAPKARLELKLSEDRLPEVYGDASQLGQVVFNLLQNALQALPGAEGTITVETGLESERCFFRVQDTGTGIQPEHLPRIFLPSFTTKPPGEGTGLGLAIAYRIVEDHGGEFRVDTEVGRGSAFTVLLPAPLPYDPSKPQHP